MSSEEARAFISTFLREECAYGILSHRWLPQGEISFQDMQPSGPGAAVIDLLKMIAQHGGLDSHIKHSTTEPGVAKIITFCQVAFRLGCNYAWFDTGCINKTSSAELEESIRSMFNWYRNSKICIVHLARTTDALDMWKDPWFTRGWTLQELLAPKTLKFYNRFWNPLAGSVDNDKIDDAALGFPLWETIEKITSIPVKDLLSFEPGIRNVRQKMAWASKRQTTRTEDMAYCLIGIFNIPLSIAYGEREMAFYRLQLKIMRRSDDKALFAWNGSPSVYNSMFAAEPICFSDPLVLQATQLAGLPHDEDTTYTLTNRGLRIHLPFFEAKAKPGTNPGEYALKTLELGTIAIITLRSQPRFTRLKVVLLGDQPTSPQLSFAILLDFDENTKQHMRIATEEVLLVERPKALQHALMFIV